MVLKTIKTSLVLKIRKKDKVLTLGFRKEESDVK